MLDLVTVAQGMRGTPLEMAAALGLRPSVVPGLPAEVPAVLHSSGALLYREGSEADVLGIVAHVALGACASAGDVDALASLLVDKVSQSNV